MLKRSFYILLLTIWCVSASSQGLKLFSPEMKKAAPKTQAVVMDFLERYFHELSTVKQTAVQTKMADDKVYFRKGKPSDLKLGCDALPFSVSLLDRYYEVSWMKADEPFVTIVFPAQYDLLLGMEKDEASKTFKDAIIAAPKRIAEVKTPSDLERMTPLNWPAFQMLYILIRYARIIILCSTTAIWPIPQPTCFMA